MVTMVVYGLVHYAKCIHICKLLVNNSTVFLNSIKGGNI